MRIDIFCRVIDNYGDAAVAWRLAKSLVQLDPTVSVRLVVEGRQTFRALAPYTGQVEVWDAQDATFEASLADVWIEAFGERSPETLLHHFCRGRARELRCRLWIHLEYLTAEAWAVDYHLLPSPQGFPGVEKYFYVPGFRPGTGGLFQDQEFLARGQHTTVSLRKDLWFKYAPGVPLDAFGLLVFSYEHDYSSLGKALAAWGARTGRDVVVFAAAGRSQEALCRAIASQVRLVELPFVTQSEFDGLLWTMDALVVRGEDSWARAVLMGKPFVWQAYLQPEGWQSVKVEAFLEVLRPWFADQAVFDRWATLHREFNERKAEGQGSGDFSVLWEEAPALEKALGEFAQYAKNHLRLEASLLEFLRRFQV